MKIHFFVWAKMWVNPLTHTGKGAKSFKECRAGGLCFLPCFLSVLHDLLHDVSQDLGRFVLLLPCCVGVGAKGEAGVEVPQHGGDRFHVHAGLQVGGMYARVPTCTASVAHSRLQGQARCVYVIRPSFGGINSIPSFPAFAVYCVVPRTAF